jgi:arsenite oxidase small subunit
VKQAAQPDDDAEQLGRKSMKRCDVLIGAGRRKFLMGAGVAAVGAVAFAVPVAKVEAAPAPARVVYPSNRLANVRDLKVDEPLRVSYPDNDAPGVLLKLGKHVPSGVGPDGDIVGFSTICPHKGFPLNYNKTDHTLNCPGHYSRFDCDAGGQQIWGQATQNLPQYMLRIDANGEIYAEGLDELLFFSRTARMCTSSSSRTRIASSIQDSAPSVARVWPR